MFIFLGVLGWLICGIVGYLAIRLEWQSGLYFQWNRGTRYVTIFYCCCFAPFMFVLGILIFIFYLWNSEKIRNYLDEEVSW